MPVTGLPAPMGYIGGVNLFGTIIRATSCGLTPKQKVDHPEVIDGTVDWTLYQLGGVEVEGSIVFPLVTGGGFESVVWEMATARGPDGELTKGSGSVVVAYGKQTGRQFNNCKVNTMEVRTTAGERVDVTMDVWGTDYSEGGSVQPISGPPTRVLQWSDVTIGGVGNCNIREFNFTINNNLSRNYTFCEGNGLFPNNISTGKRNINGTLTFQGFAPTDASASTNSASTSPGGGTITFLAGSLNVSFLNIIYEFQTIEAQPGIITSTANWYPHAAGGGISIKG